MEGKEKKMRNKLVPIAIIMMVVVVTGFAYGGNEDSSNAVSDGSEFPAAAQLQEGEVVEAESTEVPSTPIAAEAEAAVAEPEPAIQPEPVQVAVTTEAVPAEQPVCEPEQVVLSEDEVFTEERIRERGGQSNPDYTDMVVIIEDQPVPISGQ